MNHGVTLLGEKFNPTYKDHLMGLARYYLARDSRGRLFVAGRLINNFDETATSFLFRVLVKDEKGTILQELFYAGEGVKAKGFFNLPEPLQVPEGTGSVDFILEDAVFESLHYQRGAWIEKKPLPLREDAPVISPVRPCPVRAIPLLSLLFLFIAALLNVLWCFLS
jgi:hypothetical protein